MAKTDPETIKREKRKNVQWVVTIFFVTILISGTISLVSDEVMANSSVLAAFCILVAMWAVIFRTIKAFSLTDEIAGDMLIPYILWVTFAGYLNFGVYFLNR